MRIRSIKPEFWASESLSRVSREARLLFIGLFSACDDHGRTRAASRFLASTLFPYDADATKKIDGWLAELQKERCIRGYIIDGDSYLDIPKWANHQKIDRPSPSKFPPFPSDSSNTREDSRGFVIGTGSREQGEEQGEEQGAGKGQEAAPLPLVGEKLAIQQKAEGLFNRKPTTAWSKKELEALARNRAALESATDGDWKILSDFYAAEETPKHKLYRRNNLDTLLNNFPAEIDKARKWNATRSEYEGAF